MKGQDMEIRTCEQYVLAELEAAQDENARLAQENERLQAQCEILERQLGAEPSRLEAYVTAYGRKKLFKDLTYSSESVRDSSGETVPFRVWCEESMRDYGRPKWLSTAEFIEFFEPEFRKEYDEKLAEVDE